MTITMNMPGVYIREMDAPVLSLTSGATSVPVFAAKAAQMPGAGDEREEAQRYSSWSAFVARAEKIDYSNILHVSLRAYFDNGGGACHVVDSERLETLVPQLEAVTLLVAAGQGETAAFQAALNTLCTEGRGLFAILDVAKGTELDTAAMPSGPQENMHAAAYYPWLIADWAGKDADGKDIEIPPSAVMAGLYCTVDRERGVWKAPANMRIRGNLKPRFRVTDAIHGFHNRDGAPAINIIREMSGAGLSVWGARTLSRDANWRYIPVRRLFNSVQRDIRQAMSFALFEPNIQPTWERVRGAIDSYLRSLWQEGGLMGDTPQQAYFVQIGKNLTMTSEDIDAGKMVVKVGLAAVRPAEFIELRFTRNMGEVGEAASV